MEGKIRVSVVATGIGEGKPARENMQNKVSRAATYIDESYISPEEAVLPKKEFVPETTTNVEAKTVEEETV